MSRYGFSLHLNIKLSLLDKLSLMGRLISNYCCVVSSFKIFQPTLGRKPLASVEVQRVETTRPKALISARIQSSTKSSGFTLDNSKQHCSIVLYRIVIFNFISAPNYLKVVICKDFKGTREFWISSLRHQHSLHSNTLQFRRLFRYF